MFYITKQQLAELQSHLNAAQSLLDAARQQSTDSVYGKALAFPSRPMSKAEIANMAGVTTRTLTNWLRPYRSRLREMGVIDTAKILPPEAVQFICECLVVTQNEEK